MKIVYPAILTPFEEKEGYIIVVPDLKGCVSEGDTLEEAIAMGTDAACGYVISEIEDGNELPKPSKQSKFKLKKDELISFVIYDTDDQVALIRRIIKIFIVGILKYENKTYTKQQ